MQVKKSLIEENILSAARKEFVAYGFHKSSLRRIAKQANTSTGNLYNYFKSKDELFCALTQDVVDKIEHVVEARPKMINYERFTDIEWHYERMLKAVEFIHENRDDLKLIIEHSHGSSLEGFKGWFIERNSVISHSLLTKLSEELNVNNKNVSLFFFKNISTHITDFFCDLVYSDASLSEKNSYAREFLTFVHSGYLGVLGLK